MRSWYKPAGVAGWWEKVTSEDGGYMSVVAAMFVITFIGCVAVVINQHQHLDALALARETSFNAARAGGQQIDEGSLGAENIPALDPEAAEQAAEEIVAAVPEVSIQALDVDETEIVVVVEITANGILTSKTFKATGRATAIDPNR